MFIICSLLLITFQEGYSQTALTRYLATTRTADSLFAAQDYTGAVALYQEAFKANNGLGKVRHRYNAAACYTRLKMADSAFSQLNTLAGKGKFFRYDLITGDSSFTALHNDPRWLPLIEKIKDNRGKKVIID
jgi:hypothetical protein